MRMWYVPTRAHPLPIIFVINIKYLLNISRMLIAPSWVQIVCMFFPIENNLIKKYKIKQKTYVKRKSKTIGMYETRGHSGPP